MTMVKCKECGSDMNITDKNCLKCGAEIDDMFTRENTKENLLELVDEYSDFFTWFYTNEIPTDLNCYLGKLNNLALENFNILFGTIYDNEEFVSLVKKYAEINLFRERLLKDNYFTFDNKYFEEQEEIKRKIEKIVDTFFKRS